MNWSQTDLAEAASVGVATVRRLETAHGKVRGSVDSVWKIQTALESAGVEFLPAEGGKGPGVRLRTPPQC